MSWSLGKAAAALLAIAMAASGCSYKFLFWERNVWQDAEGIFAMVEPADAELYRDRSRRWPDLASPPQTEGAESRGHPAVLRPSSESPGEGCRKEASFRAHTGSGPRISSSRPGHTMRRRPCRTRRPVS
jgi:hypothetical protein